MVGTYNSFNLLISEKMLILSRTKDLVVGPLQSLTRQAPLIDQVILFPIINYN